MSPLREIFLFFFFFFPRTFFSFFSLSDSAIFFDDQSDINTFFFFFLFPFPLPSFLPGRCHMDLETRIVRGYSFRIDCSTIGNVQCIETKRKRKTNSLPGNLGFPCGKPVLPGHRVLNNLIFQSDFFFFFLFLIKLNLYHRKNSFEKFEISFLQGEGGRKKNYLDPEVVTIPFMEPSTIVVLPEPWTTSPHGSSWDVAKNQNSRSIALAISIERA